MQLKINCCRDWYWFCSHRILSYFYCIWHRFSVVDFIAICLFIYVFANIFSSFFLWFFHYTSSIKSIITKYLNSSGSNYQQLYDIRTFRCIFVVINTMCFLDGCSSSELCTLYEVYESVKIKWIQFYWENVKCFGFCAIIECINGRKRASLPLTKGCWPLLLWDVQSILFNVIYLFS